MTVSRTIMIELESLVTALEEALTDSNGIADIIDYDALMIMHKKYKDRFVEMHAEWEAEDPTHRVGVRLFPNMHGG